MRRRALLRLLGLLPFAPLLRLAPAAAAPVYMKQYASYVAVHPKVYELTMEIPGMAVPAAQQWIERQRRREAAWAVEFYRDGAP